MEKEANSILEQHKQGKLTTDKARRLLFVLSGVSKSTYCKLDRLKEECSIAQHISPKGECGGCGHYC